MTWHEVKRAVNAVKGVEFVSRDKRYSTITVRLLSTYAHASLDESELPELDRMARDEETMSLNGLHHIARPTDGKRRFTVTALCGVEVRREVSARWIDRVLDGDKPCQTCRVLLDGEIEEGRARLRSTVEWATVPGRPNVRRFHSFVPGIETGLVMPAPCSVCGMHRDSDAHAGF